MGPTTFTLKVVPDRNQQYNYLAVKGHDWGMSRVGLETDPRQESENTPRLWHRPGMAQAVRKRHAETRDPPVLIALVRV